MGDRWLSTGLWLTMLAGLAMTLVSEGAQHQRLDQGLAFGLANLAWAAGQAVAAAGSGTLAQAISDLVPYSLLAAACLVTLGLIRVRHRPAGLSPRAVPDQPASRRARVPVVSPPLPGRSRTRSCG